MTKRSLVTRLIVLAILLVVGALLSIKNSPLNFLNLFQQVVRDTASVERVEEQQAAQTEETMVQTMIDGNTLTHPSEVTVERMVSGRGKLRMMALAPDGLLLVTEKDQGNVLGIDLGNGTVSQIITGLDNPSGIAFRENELWVAEESQVIRFDYQGSGQVGSKTVVIAGLPVGGHDTRTIGFGPDGKLYIAVGSSCNVCEESDGRRAAITRYNPDGTGEERFAEGLRNTVGFVWHPETGEMWGVDNGRDLIGDDLPPEEVNIVKQGKHYGWPYCYGRGVANPEYKNRSEFCQLIEFPAVEMKAHSAPLGLRFLEGGSWPDRYDGNLFIAFHGSWNRSEPTGYKIVRVDKDRKVHDFLSGWLKPDDQVWGRPVDVLFIGYQLFITDDAGGSIYKVSLNT